MALMAFSSTSGSMILGLYDSVSAKESQAAERQQADKAKSIAVLVGRLKNCLCIVPSWGSARVQPALIPLHAEPYARCCCIGCLVRELKKSSN